MSSLRFLTIHSTTTTSKISTSASSSAGSSPNSSTGGVGEDVELARALDAHASQHPLLSANFQEESSLVISSPVSGAYPRANVLVSWLRFDDHGTIENEVRISDDS